MLTHHQAATDPARVVVLGSRGFVGRAVLGLLAANGVPTLALPSSELDLAQPGAGDKLAERLEEGDSLLFLSALTPDKGRDIATSMANMRMGEAVAAAVTQRPVGHVVYFSSDAVYGFETPVIDEATPVAPADCYGGMHLMRELMLKSTVKAPLAILRCTAVYGAGDTHNSYGPNRFRRLAAKDGRIGIGGEGEETRDHLYIDDVAALVAAVLRQRSAGILNLASGRSVSFRELAEMVAGGLPAPATVVPSPRSSPITHRRFDVSATARAFPDFSFTPLEHGLETAWRAEAG